MVLISTAEAAATAPPAVSTETTTKESPVKAIETTAASTTPPPPPAPIPVPMELAPVPAPPRAPAVEVRMKRKRFNGFVDRLVATTDSLHVTALELLMTRAQQVIYQHRHQVEKAALLVVCGRKHNTGLTVEQELEQTLQPLAEQQRHHYNKLMEMLTSPSEPEN